MLRTDTEASEVAMSRGNPGVHEPVMDDSPEGQVMSRAAAAQQICLHLLTGRPRSRAELTDALGRRGIPEEVGEPVLDRLSELGLMNDTAFAEAAVYSGHRHRGLGKRALSSELRRRGVPDEIVREAVSTVPPEDEEQRARELVRRRLRSSTMRDTTTLARKLSAMLVRKGYSEGLIWQVVRDELGSDNWSEEVESCLD